MAGPAPLRRCGAAVRRVELGGPVPDDLHGVGLHQLGSDPLVVVAVQLVPVAPRVDEIERPAQVEVHEIAGENTTVIELKVAKEDLGKIIGKQGRTARAVRTVLNGASTKLRKRTVLEIIE